jgi:hypothetical protein
MNQSSLVIVHLSQAGVLYRGILGYVRRGYFIYYNCIYGALNCHFYQDRAISRRSVCNYFEVLVRGGFRFFVVSAMGSR